MLCPPKKGYTEEDYYFGEWTAAERENGEHMAVVKFVRPKFQPWTPIPTPQRELMTVGPPT